MLRPSSLFDLERPGHIQPGVKMLGLRDSLGEARLALKGCFKKREREPGNAGQSPSSFSLGLWWYPIRLLSLFVTISMKYRGFNLKTFMEMVSMTIARTTSSP
jgi:hypothetical protein